MLGATLYGVPAATSLTAGGFQDPTSESARANRVLADTFGQGDMQLIVTVTDPQGADTAQARAVGEQIVRRIERDPSAVRVVSRWTAPPPATAALTSRDGRTGLVIADLAGGEDRAPLRAQRLADEITAEVPQRGVAVQTGGSAIVLADINSQTQRDVLVMEAIAIPLTFLLLVWVFKGVLAAALPVAVGGLAIVGAMSVLRLLASWTDVSIFALNLSTALGLALAIDYTLLIVSRFRDELDSGADPEQALRTTMRTAGRTVAFSALTVALSMSAMALFPMYFLKSFAYAGVATVVLCAGAAIVVTPAVIVLLGRRVAPAHGRHRSRATQRRFWYRTSKVVVRHAIPCAVVGTLALLALGIPFLGASWGMPDDRVLPRSAPAHQVGETLRSQFPQYAQAPITVVIPDATGLSAGDFAQYAAAAARLPDVSAVSRPALRDGAAYLTVSSSAPAFTAESERQLDELRALPGPGGRSTALTGIAQINRDSVQSIVTRLPVVGGVIAAVTFVLLFLLSGSIAIPIKSLLLNVLSLTATFGALVWIFQDGHLGALGTTPTGTLVANVPVLMFCVAFGLSMDYEVFIVARIREYWLAGGRTRADNDESVARGLAHTGRVVTAAALVMSISFGALIAAQVSFMRMFGLGLTLAVLVDATLVRMVLLPAYMHLLGPANWWAPAPLRRLHDRLTAGDRSLD